MDDEVIQQMIGEQARQARTAMGLTQAQVAARAKMSAQVYGRLERGGMMPSVPTLRRLAVALGTSPGVLLGITPREVPRTENDWSPGMQRAVGLMRSWSDARVELGCELLRALDGAPSSLDDTPTGSSEAVSK